MPYVFASQGGNQSITAVTQPVTITSAVIKPFDPCGGGTTIQHFAVVANATITEADALASETARLAVTTDAVISPGGSDILQKTVGNGPPG